MANLDLNDELLVRDFFERIASRDDLFPGQPVQARQLRAACLGLLGYTVVQGTIVRKNNVEAYTYGEAPKAKDDWQRDTAAAREAASRGHTNKADSGESS